MQLDATSKGICLLEEEKHHESDFRSTETSSRLSVVALTGNGKSISMFGGAKYMCSDIIQIIIPKKSCNDRRKENEVY